MIDVNTFGEALGRLKYNFFTGVPCSFQKHFINYAINHFRYIGAVNEGDAVAASAGAALGGRRSVALMQNSGLTNALSPLTSLNYTFRIPLLGFVSLRGEPGVSDEPQHDLTGTMTEKMLAVARADHALLSRDTEEAIAQLQEADRAVKNNRVFFFIVRKNTFSEEPLVREPQPVSRPVRSLLGSDQEYIPKTRLSVLQVIDDFKDDDTLILAATGKTGRELFETGDSPHNFYMVGSMGCLGALGLGLSLARPDKKIIAVDGDGALLMRLGTLATNGYYGGGNLLHILLDNGVHDSTGGQPTVSGNIDLPKIAFSCGYPAAIEINTLEELEKAVRDWKKTPALTFLHVKIEKGAKKNLGRPTMTPEQVKTRFMEFIGSRI